jgi:hypothetical protein
MLTLKFKDMKKFSLILFSMMVGAMVHAQQPAVNTLWEHSMAGSADWSTGIPVGGEVPSWMGDLTEHGLVYHDGMLYVVSRKNTPHAVRILDAETGMPVDSIAIDTTIFNRGNFTVHNIAVTDSGQILLSNQTSSTMDEPFRIYLLEMDTLGNHSFSTLIEWQDTPDTTNINEQTTYALGDGFTVFGEVGDGGNGYILVADANASAQEQVIFRWDFQNGQADSVPQRIVLQEIYPSFGNVGIPNDTIPNDTIPDTGLPGDTIPGDTLSYISLGLSPTLHAVDENHFWADGYNTYPALYNMQGELVQTFRGDVRPGTTNVSGLAFFTFQNEDYLLTPATGHFAQGDTAAASFQLFRMTQTGAEDAELVAVFPERGLGTNMNSTYASSMDVDVQDDRVLMFVLVPNNGIAAFELTLDGDTSIVADGTWNFSSTDFNILGQVDSLTEVNGLSIYATNEGMISISEDPQVFEDATYTHGLYLENEGVFDLDGQPESNVLAFEVEPNTNIIIIGQAAGEADSEVHLAAGSPDSVLITLPVSGSEVTRLEHVYTDEPITLYLYTSNNGLILYNIILETVATSVNPVAGLEDVRVYPNPASDRVFVSVQRPTQVGIYNLAGSLVKSRLIESKNDFIEVNDLQPGMYLIKSQFSNDFSHKLIVR